jgi:hypothetical protein
VNTGERVKHDVKYQMFDAFPSGSQRAMRQPRREQDKAGHRPQQTKGRHEFSWPHWCSAMPITAADAIVVVIAVPPSCPAPQG